MSASNEEWGPLRELVEKHVPRVWRTAIGYHVACECGEKFPYKGDDDQPGFVGWQEHIAEILARKVEEEKFAALVALDELYADNHYWSTRPCETCEKLTEYFGRPFGCIRFAQERARRAELEAS